MDYTVESMALELAASFPATTVDFEAVCFNALADFNMRCPRTKQVTLTLTTDLEYTVPPDVQYFINLTQGVVGFYYHDRKASKITFTEKPLYQGDITVKYAGGVVFDKDDATAVLTELDDIAYSVVMLCASSKALNTIGGNAAKDAFSYTLGTQSVDRRVMVQAYKDQADAFNTQYLDACRAYNRSMII